VDNALAEFDPMIRGEVLSIEEFADLANKIYEIQNNG
jgi:hypothetical protein